jgi:hypothetical protein
MSLANTPAANEPERDPRPPLIGMLLDHPFATCDSGRVAPNLLRPPADPCAQTSLSRQIRSHVWNLIKTELWSLRDEQFSFVIIRIASALMQIRPRSSRHDRTLLAGVVRYFGGPNLKIEFPARPASLRRRVQPCDWPTGVG